MTMEIKKLWEVKLGDRVAFFDDGLPRLPHHRTSDPPSASAIVRAIHGDDGEIDVEVCDVDGKVIDERVYAGVKRADGPPTSGTWKPIV